MTEVLGKETPYVVNEIEGAFAFYEKYTLVFDMISKENKLVVRATLSDMTLEEQQKVEELGYAYITFDEEGRIHPSETFTSDILVGEFEASQGITVSQMVKKVKEPLNQFIEKIDNL